MTNLPARAKVVGAIADEHADAGDQQGQLAQPVVDALHHEGILGMWTPAVVKGGFELDPISSLETIENVSYGDPSAGWVTMASALAIGTGAAYLQSSAVEELFGGERLPVIAGQGTRPGTAVPDGDGFPRGCPRAPGGNRRPESCTSATCALIWASRRPTSQRKE